MKKIISILLCLVFAISMLASCGSEEVGELLDESMKGYEKEEITLNLYVIGSENSSANATVNARISNYCQKKYKTKLNVVYCSEENYASTVTSNLDAAKAAIEAGETYNMKPDIFIINSNQMMHELYEKGHLADITEFFYPEIYEQRIEIYPEQKNKFHAELIKNCEGLHNQIAETLIDASVLYEDIYDETTMQNITNTKHYCVPNNRVVGQYEYLLIHRDTAEEIGYVGADNQFDLYKTYEDTADLRAKIEAKGLNVSDYVRVVYGKYEHKAMYENGNNPLDPTDTKKYACNIISYPEVSGFYDKVTEYAPNVESVFDSAFAVNSLVDVDRAMEIVYALNTDVTLINHLYYGVQDTNYTVDLKTGMIDTTYAQIKDENKYFMDSKYIGDAFKLHLSPVWNEADRANGKKQNDASVIYTAD